MTKNLASDKTSELTPLLSARGRLAFVDLFRGLLIAHMALDHASLMFNAGRAAEELAAGPAPAFGDAWQFLTRFTGVPVAPGFFFMAGFMVALTSASREGRGISHQDVTRRLVIRGLVLIAVDALIMGLPRALMGFYSFMVLSSIGVAVIALAFLRDVPDRILIPLALGLLLLHPLIDVSALPVAIRAIVYEPVRTGAIRSLYPIVPWIGVVLLGFIIGRRARIAERSQRLWIVLGTISLVLFLLVRLGGGYGNAYPHAGITSVEFWTFAKYPPDLAFLTWSFACVFAALALLSWLVPDRVPMWLRPFEVFGRVPFFFYVAHFYVLGVAMALLRAKLGLAATYAVWLALLAVMLWPCVWYYRLKRDRPNLITRYF